MARTRNPALTQIHRDFAANLRDLRELLEVSQEELARRMNTSRSYISDLERLRFCPTLDLVERCALALRRDRSELLARR